MTDTLPDVPMSDHARGCDGRTYSCSCGYDLQVEERLDRLAEVERERDEARSELQRAATEFNRACDKVERRAEAAERDAARYRWLKTFAKCDPKMDGNHFWYALSFRPNRGPTFDAAIDAAIAKERPCT